MQFIFAFILVLINSGISYADISTLRIYPSFIKVDLTIPVIVIETTEEEENRKKNRKKDKNKLQKDVDQQKTELKTFDRLIRVINSVPLEANKMFLIFFDEENQIIDQILISNTVRPSSKFITFMERSSNPRFQGKLDVYQIPSEAFSFSIAVIDTNDNIVTQVKHDLFNENDSVLLSDYDRITSKKPVLLQFEIIGQENNLRVLVGLFAIS